MTDVAVDTLRLRGPHARRLAAVAARALPAALERALADVGDVRADEVVVRLPFDVSAHDDETIAVLWADAIRARLLALGPTPAPGGGAAAPARAAGGHVPGPVDVLAAVRALATVGAEHGTPLPRAVLALSDTGTARTVADVLGPRAWAAALGTLARVLPLPPPGPAPCTDSAASTSPAPVDLPWALPPTEGARADTAGPSGDAPPAADARRETGTAPEAAPHPMDPAHGPDQLFATLAVLEQLLDEHATAVAAEDVTRCAGLVLLYPWLAEHCRRAEELHPGLDGLDVREAALAALLDPDDPSLADDPLIALLAGRERTDPGRTRLPLPRADEVMGSAVRVLTSFAALLPGFEQSSPAFVRTSWIARLGVVDTDRDPVLLTAGTLPLDVVLPRLPYPVGLIKLPWSPPLTVRFRP